jgi:hypothetical protein
MNSLLDLLAKESVKVAALERIYADNHGHPEFAAAAIRAVRQLDSDLAWRAVWLLKRLARDRKLSDTDLVQLALCADEMPHWASRLNLCQLFATTGCPSSGRDALYPYLVECFANRRVMIRAWAISVLVKFQDDPKYRKQVTAMLRNARADSGSSMIARLRQLSGPTKRGRTETES